MTMQQPIQRMRDPEPNEAQLKAIVNLDDDLLVAAGAGSGKTWVLTERYMEMLARGARPGQIVAITFTELAAAEMKRRIRGAVEKWIDQAEDPAEKKRWRRMHSELDSAVISTIHGFCMRILKEHPVEAGIDPQAKVLEPEDAERLLAEAVDELLEEALRERFEEIKPLYLAWGGRRGIVESLLAAHEAIQTFDYPVEQILADTERSFAWMRSRIPEIVDEIDKLVDAAIRPELSALLADGKKKPPQYACQMEAWVRQWRERSPLLRVWDGVAEPGVRQTLRDLAKGLWRRSGSETLKEAHRQIKEVLLPQLARLELGPDASARVRAFCGLLTSLEARYNSQKEQRNALDFHDLERLTARLLEEYPEVAAMYGKRFRFVMVDEFQDTNRLQKSIIDRLAGGGSRIKKFLVGDGKQSIYKFRGADVDIFQEVEEAHRLSEAGERLIDMGTNFRTQAGIIHYINDFFADLMQNAEVKHARQVRFAKLHPARNPAHDNPCVEILVCRPVEGTDARDEEADWIARRIRELVDTRSPLVYRKRPGEPEESAHSVRYGDIALLFSATTHLSAYEKALQRYGIPYAVEKGRQFYRKQEITDLCSWLTALVDPADEVALAALLRSPVFALSDETLFWLAQEGSLAAGLALVADAVSVPGGGPAVATSPAGSSAVSSMNGGSKEPQRVPGRLSRLKERLGEEEYEKTVWAVTRIAKWRESFPLHPLSDFLWSILRESGYLEVLLAGFGGEQRYANVLKLVEIAGELQRKEGYGVAEFAEHLKRMQEDEVQETEAQLGGSSVAGGGAVRLMTVHASKGLEFPVVILPDLKRPLKIGDVPRCLIRPGMGMGLKAERFGESAAEGELDVRGDGLYHLMKERENERELLEEQRKLYVAMTRARDYLILAVTQPKMEALSWQKWILRHAGFEKWDDLVPGVLEREAPGRSGRYRVAVNDGVGQPPGHLDAFRKNPWEMFQMFSENDGEGGETDTGQPDEGSPGLMFSVGDPDAPQLPTLSASAYMAYHTCQRRFYLRYLFQLPEPRLSEEMTAGSGGSADRLPDREEEVAAENGTDGDGPDGITGSAAGLPGTKWRRIHADLRGTLVHELFERLREPERKTEWIRKTLQAAKGIRAEDLPAVASYLEKMADRYLNSPWFRPDSLREQAFYLKAGSAMVHGFIDVVIPEADGTLTVVDFKTNEVRSAEQMAELADGYRSQLQLYAMAAQAVFRKRVKRAVLYFLDADASVDVDVGEQAIARLADDLAETCKKLLESYTLEAYPLTEQRAVCGRCGYRVLCGRSEGGT